jgi:hypothetical protein
MQIKWFELRLSQSVLQPRCFHADTLPYRLPAGRPLARRAFNAY